jgi:hypothetical protein
MVPLLADADPIEAVVGGDPEEVGVLAAAEMDVGRDGVVGM